MRRKIHPSIENSYHDPQLFQGLHGTSEHVSDHHFVSFENSIIDVLPGLPSSSDGKWHCRMRVVQRTVTSNDDVKSTKLVIVHCTQCGDSVSHSRELMFWALVGPLCEQGATAVGGIGEVGDYF